MVIAALSFASSLTLPFVFRACDRIERSPKVDITCRYLHRLNMIEHSSLIERVVSSWNMPTALQQVLPDTNTLWAEHFLWGMDHRLFRIKVVNRREVPVSLSNCRLEDVRLLYPSDTENPMMLAPVAHVVSVSADRTRIDPFPVITVEPNGTAVLDIIASTFVRPRGAPAVELVKKTDKFLTSCASDGIDPEDIRKSHCFVVEVSQVRNGSTNTLFMPIYYPLFEKLYMTSVKLKSARFVATDNMGQQVISDELDQRETW